MKNVFLTAALLFSLLISAAPAKHVIYHEERAAGESVTPTGLFTVTDNETPRKTQKAQKSSLASRLTQTGKDFFWKPSQIEHKATGGADLTDACLSQDESLLVIAEKIGGTNKNNATRLILFDLKNKRIAAGHLLKKRRITAIRFLPGTDQLLAVQEEQPVFGNKNAVIKVDLKTGEVTASSLSAPGKITSFCSNGRKVWYTVENVKQIFELSAGDLSASAGISTAVSAPKAALSPDNSHLVVYGNGPAEIYAVAGNRSAGLAETADLPGTQKDAICLVLNNKASQLLFVEPEKKVVFVQNGVSRTLVEKNTALSAYFPKHNALLQGVEKLNAIVNIALPGGDQTEKPLQPGKLKPLSRNANWALLPLSAKNIKAVLIDHRGNIMILEKTKRRWKKYVLLTVDKTGYR